MNHPNAMIRRAASTSTQAVCIGTLELYVDAIPMLSNEATVTQAVLSMIPKEINERVNSRRG